jgi:hypothetical protein
MVVDCIGLGNCADEGMPALPLFLSYGRICSAQAGDTLGDSLEIVLD